MKSDVLDSEDPRIFTKNIQCLLDEVIDHVRKDSHRIQEPEGQALLETTAEVLMGLRTAYEHYATGSKKAMR